MLVIFQELQQLYHLGIEVNSTPVSSLRLSKIEVMVTVTE